MSWGLCYLCYTCAGCRKKFKYAIDMIAELGDDFGKCPVCGMYGIPESKIAVVSGDPTYEEVDT